MNKVISFFKKYKWDFLIVALFAVISFAYFFPADVEGRILFREDTSAGRGAGVELSAHREQYGEYTRWTNVTFSGMPTYQTAPSYDSTDLLAKVMNAYHLWLPSNVWYVFVYLLGFYIMLRAFNFRKELAVLGSIIWAFSSYFFIIIAAGHIWKVMALAYLPPLIAGIVLSYRGKYLWGFILTVVFSAFEIKANHVQMTYYYMFIIFFLVLAFLYEAIKEKKLAQFGKATGIALAAGLLGVCMNISNLYHTWEYQKETMRGGSELAQKSVKGQNGEQSEDITSKGLSFDYITGWSYGADEMLTLMVPNAKGGASVPLSRSDKAMEKANPDYSDLGVYDGIGQYWGNQPGTSGPVYVGAFIVLLFIIGLFIVDGPVKWALLASTVLSIFLSMGHNFPWLSHLFIDHFPLYSKFRTVSSILVIAEFTIPLLAVMALKKIIEQPEILKKDKPVIIASYVITGGLCFILALIPSIYSDVFSIKEMEAMREAGWPTEIIDNLRAMRLNIFTADCWRSFWIITVGFALLWVYQANKLRKEFVVIILAALCFVDMWTVNKRYLNDEMFVHSQVRDLPQEKTKADEMILQDKDLDYRVLNLTSNTFNENETSYYHKSVGGYHAAKLQRYNDLINYYLTPEKAAVFGEFSDTTQHMPYIQHPDYPNEENRLWAYLNGKENLTPVLNMLNTKYFIYGSDVVFENPYSNGQGWFVGEVKYVDNANDELSSLGKLDLKYQAVADKKFQNAIGKTTEYDPESSVEVTNYKANELTYKVKSKNGGVVVFSEIYYPGWKATVDGKEVEIGRANYVLRAINVPAGEHQVVFTFKPQSVKTTEAIAYSAYVILLLIIGGGIWFAVRKKKTQSAS